MRVASDKGSYAWNPPSHARLAPASARTRSASLGAGGMGEVYQARDARLGRDVAIKVAAAHSTDAPQARERFEREARAVAGLQHPNICTIYDVGDADGRAFIVMELLHGETLQQRLRRGPMDLPAFLEIGIALADGLHAAHAPASSTVTSSPPTSSSPTRGPKILDFGLAKAEPTRHGAATSAERNPAMLTESGQRSARWPTCRRNNCAAKRSTPEPICSR